MDHFPSSALTYAASFNGDFRRTATTRVIGELLRTRRTKVNRLLQPQVVESRSTTTTSLGFLVKDYREYITASFLPYRAPSS